MKFGRCMREDHGSVGCSADVLTQLDRKCSGRHACHVTIPDAALHDVHPCPRELMPYLEASYSCLPGENAYTRIPFFFGRGGANICIGGGSKNKIDATSRLGVNIYKHGMSSAASHQEQHPVVKVCFKTTRRIPGPSKGDDKYMMLYFNDVNKTKFLRSDSALMLTMCALQMFVLLLLLK